MTGKDLLVALNDIEDWYILETACIQPVRKKWPRLVAAAGMLLLLIGGGFLYLGRLPARHAETQKAEVKDSTEAEHIDMHQPLEDQGLLISMQDICFNALDPIYPDSSRRFLDMEWAKTWTYKEVLKQYSPMLEHLYIPKELKPAQTENSLWTYFQKPDGEMIENTVWFGFYHDYYADGSPMLTEEVPAVKGVSIVASKTGIIQCCVYMEREEPVRRYTFNGIEITFGKRSIPHGPYDPETHAPKGYYEEYTAEFIMDGAEYLITATQLEPVELVRIAASLTCGGKGYTVE